MRALGVDLGTVRIGLATCDAGGTLASPFATWPRSRDRARFHRDLAALVREEEVEVVVVGLPLSMDGSDGPAAVAARAEAAEMARTVGVPVVLHDERLTTVEAHRLLAEGGVNGRERRRVVDRAAAAVLLQAWLDGGSPMGATVAPTDGAEESDPQ